MSLRMLTRSTVHSVVAMSSSASSRLFSGWPKEGLGPFETVLCTVLFFVSPFETYLVFTVGGVVKYVLLFAILLIFYMDYRRGRVVRLDWYVVFFLAWLVYKILTLLWTQSFAVPMTHFASQIGMVGFLFALASIEVGERQRNALVFSYLAGSSLFCLLSLVFMEPSGVYTQRFVLTLFGVQTDPNNAAATALPAFALSFYYLMRARKFWSKTAIIAMTAIAAVAVYVILMTGSRGGMIAAAASAIVVVFFSRDLRPHQKALALALMVALVVFAVGLIPQDTYARLFKTDYGDGSGRTELWRVVWAAFMSNPFFGVGWGMTSMLNRGTATHNTFLSMLAEQGVFGTALFLAPLVYLAVRSWRERSTLPLVLLICAAGPALTIDAINKRFVWYGITLAMLFLDSNRRSQHRRAGIMEDRC